MVVKVENYQNKTDGNHLLAYSDKENKMKKLNFSAVLGYYRMPENTDIYFSAFTTPDI